MFPVRCNPLVDLFRTLFSFCIARVFDRGPFLWVPPRSHHRSCLCCYGILRIYSPLSFRGSCCGSLTPVVGTFFLSFMLPGVAFLGHLVTKGQDIFTVYLSGWLVSFQAPSGNFAPSLLLFCQGQRSPFATSQAYQSAEEPRWRLFCVPNLRGQTKLRSHLFLPPQIRFSLTDECIHNDGDDALTRSPPTHITTVLLANLPLHFRAPPCFS